MDTFVERVAESMAGKIDRRGLLSQGLRGLMMLGTGAAILFGPEARALQPSTECDDHFGGGANNTCGVSAGYCDANASGNGCNPARTRCSAQYCDAPLTSNCQGGYVNLGYWDCCCDGKIVRCRDCGPSGGPVQCICAATVGNC